ncbi:hypothetical protein AJ79_00845 [Helicocarpus griseus UAMH5409]|uniref:Zn(2)-C6 fungal-type domain-containing protein n=1 Tax=Helicocarpus griseus UAMH5409 TaxID=1447875 RepID=A0A2B7Y8V9_9EURO|nr:hypothetical protein AJ79_00845 [Helicocarpus griseus UAMH5409]
MVQRRSHTKSRKGCFECKRRHIKCNEARPVCSNCQRLESNCTWPIRKNAAVASWIDDSVSSGSQHGTSAEPETPGLAVNDLRLLHHYTMNTRAVMDRSPTHDTWRSTVVEYGFRHHFLLRGILAVSALHLSTLHRDESRELFLQSTTHIGCALREFRILLSNPDPSITGPMFALAAILVLHGLGTAQVQTPEDPIGALVHCISLVRGVRAVVNRDYARLLMSEFGPLINVAQRHGVAGEIVEVRRLKELIRDREKNESMRNQYFEAVDELHEIFLELQALDDERSAVAYIFSWAALSPERFMISLSKREPVALVILAYYAVLFQTSKKCWWLQGWYQRILDAVHAAVGPGYEDWLAWPRQQAVYFRA